MQNREALQKRLLATFREEAAEHAQTLEEELKRLAEADGAVAAQGHLENLFRAMHTLKGAARSVRFVEIETLCQDSESMLHGITRGETALTEQHITRLRTTLEALSRLIHRPAASVPVAAPPAPAIPAPQLPAEITAPAPAPASAPAAAVAPPEKPPQPIPAAEPPAPPKPDAIPAAQQDQTAPAARPADTIRDSAGNSVRVNVGQLDHLLRAAENLLLPSLVVGERAKTARRLADSTGQLRRRLRNDQARDHALDHTRHGEAPERAAERRDALLEQLRSIENEARRLALALQEDHRGLTTAIGDLFNETRQARMLPATSIFGAFPAMVRDICQETGKLAKWRLRDGGIELDRKVLEIVKHPLIHLVRNAVDHGIEAPERREAAGKPRRGRVTASILAIDGGRVAIEISDDGAGMDLSALRHAALRARITNQTQLETLSDQDVLDLAFRSGVSTRAVISSISGLGLGLSIVREQIERMDGRVIVQSQPGKGTTIRLELPASVASYRGLVVTVGKLSLLWPAEAVARVLGLTWAEAEAALHAGFHPLGDAALPFMPLADLLNLPPADIPARRQGLCACILVSVGSKRAVVMVDSVVGTADVLMKDLPPPLKRVRHIASAGLLATGTLALVLRPSDILASIHSGRSRARRQAMPAVERTRRILVVDDSMTTRMMERNLFEAVGYAVEVAADGIEGWEKLRSSDFDLVVSDIDMPRLNGFELTARIRADDKLADLPVVLVTALESREDRDHGIRIGANAYVLKSSFDQTNLLEIVGRLI